MNSYYDNQNFFLRWFGKMADVVLLSLLWVLCSLPLVTMGAASIALYDTIARCIHGTHESPYKYFLHVYKKELLRGGRLWPMCWWLGILICIHKERPTPLRRPIRWCIWAPC